MNRLYEKCPACGRAKVACISTDACYKVAGRTAQWGSELPPGGWKALTTLYDEKGYTTGELWQKPDGEFVVIESKDIPAAHEAEGQIPQVPTRPINDQERELLKKDLSTRTWLAPELQQFASKHQAQAQIQVGDRFVNRTGTELEVTSIDEGTDRVILTTVGIANFEPGEMGAEGSPMDITLSGLIQMVEGGWVNKVGTCKQARSFDEWLMTFIEEKGIDIGEVLVGDVQVGDVVQGAIMAPANEQAQIKDTIVKIDFMNGDVRDFLRHLAQAPGLKERVTELHMGRIALEMCPACGNRKLYCKASDGCYKMAGWGRYADRWVGPGMSVKEFLPHKVHLTSIQPMDYMGRPFKMGEMVHIVGRLGIHKIRGYNRTGTLVRFHCDGLPLWETANKLIKAAEINEEYQQDEAQSLSYEDGQVFAEEMLLKGINTFGALQTELSSMIMNNLGMDTGPFSDGYWDFLKASGQVLDSEYIASRQAQATDDEQEFADAIAAQIADFAGDEGDVGQIFQLVKGKAFTKESGRTAAKINDEIRRALDTLDAELAQKIMETLRFSHGMNYDDVMRRVEKIGRDPRDFEALVLEGEGRVSERTAQNVDDTRKALDEADTHLMELVRYVENAMISAQSIGQSAAVDKMRGAYDLVLQARTLLREASDLA